MPNHRGKVPEIGEKYWDFVIIDNKQKINSCLACLCKCKCGNYKIVENTRLRNGTCKSCGCRKRSLKGKSNTRLYMIYRHMKERCYNPNNDAYDKYGGRGIEICDEWNNDFMAFYNWSISNGYADGLSIDRINNNKGYSPDNCRWADDETQQNNTRWNHNITYNGKTQSLSKWARELNMPITTLHTRLSKGWPIEKCFFLPRQRRNAYSK